jgi:hypothetical protein
MTFVGGHFVAIGFGSLLRCIGPEIAEAAFR